ncbi:TAXI family TRAP transporter solute-binding subunit [Nocardioides insulae]|uniref:TAXI family TRAP transporter solute-binding subunit n=1 Tax=Nocardioides insulae TaxID=394734 RepID=UPI00041AF86E|nr:TAXI family TRAP transporter solute-binding subunit [Nocardioides insulae]
MTSRRHGLVALLAAGVLAFSGCGGGEDPAQSDTPLDVVAMSTYGTGTATFADVAAVADAVTTQDDTRFRIITSDTAIGRVLPLKDGQTQFARTGDEYIFAFRGEYDFADEDWGPQPIRVVWAPTAPHSWMVKASSDIHTAADLAGKKVPRITANPSVNQKTVAMLATAGLTWDDVEPVDIGYGEQPDALKAGKLDILFQQVYGSSLFELESSTPVRWLEFDPSDPQTQKAVAEGVPSVELGEFSGAPGQEEGETSVGFWYAVPVVTYADTSDVVAAQMAHSVLDSYDRYADATSTTSGWSIDEAMTEPKEVPFHPGLIQVLKEEGVWTPEAQAKQDELLAQEKLLEKGWEEVQGAEDLEQAWADWKAENLEEKTDA